MKFAYVDSSVILRKLLRELDKVVSFANYERIFTSEITEIECMRALNRVKFEQQISEDELVERYQELNHRYRGFEIIKMNPDVLKRTKEAFPISVKTLDAIHLSSLLITKAAIFPNAQWTFISHDQKQNNAALALGLEILD